MAIYVGSSGDGAALLDRAPGGRRASSRVRVRPSGLLGNALDQALLDGEDRLAVECRAAGCGGLRLSYAQLAARVNRLAVALAACHLGAGARVAILEHDCHRIVEAFYAVARLGGVLVPLKAGDSLRHHAASLAAAQPDALLIGPSYLPLLWTMRTHVEHIVVLGQSAPLGLQAYEPMLKATGRAVLAPRFERPADAPAMLFAAPRLFGRPKLQVVSEASLAFAAQPAWEAVQRGGSDGYVHHKLLGDVDRAAAVWGVAQAGGYLAIQPDD